MNRKKRSMTAMISRRNAKRTLGLMILSLLSVATVASARSSAPSAIPESIVQRIEEVGGHQSAAVRDGAISNQELHGAFDDAVNCMRANGAAISAEWHGAGDLTVKILQTTASGLQATQSLVDRCLAENFDPLAAAYASLYGPSDGELADGKAIFATCAMELGIAAEDPSKALEQAHELGVRANLEACFEAEANFLRSKVASRAGR